MNKGQKVDPRLKNTLKYLKLNEDKLSTILGLVVVFLVGALMFNYFRNANLKTWQGVLLNDDKPATTTAVEIEKPSQDIVTYKVVKGDDLWHISEKYYKSGYNYVDLIKENKLDSKGRIEVGMELRIPKVEAKKLTVIESKKMPSLAIKDDMVIEKPKVDSLETGEYLTKKGDTYWNIAVRAYGDGFKWTKIYWANRKTFSNPDVIYSGTKIIIPAIK